MPPLKQALADPPVLIAVDFHCPVVEKAGDHALGAAGARGLPREHDQRLAFHQQFGFPVSGETPEAALARLPDPVTHAAHRDQSVRAGGKKGGVRLLDIRGGHQRATGAADDQALVFVRQPGQNGAKFRREIEREEAERLVVMEARAVALADEGDLLAVGDDDHVPAGGDGQGCVKRALNERLPGQPFDELVGNDRVFLDRGDDHAPPQGCHAAPDSCPPPVSRRLASVSRVASSMMSNSASLRLCWKGKEICPSKKASALGQSALSRPSFR